MTLPKEMQGATWRQGGVRPKAATKQDRVGQVKVGHIQCVISVWQVDLALVGGSPGGRQVSGLGFQQRGGLGFKSQRSYPVL